ncbi:uncharacterized protein LOC143741245 [Siphateles boraxobius]|uniref:uncharacterized protein LOC143741245 n=1 Tax=Siphateles boraxobius TaxID=180520 RepID=UPI004064AC89
MPGPTQAQSQELIPGYLTPLSCEFVSVSTGPADREREWQRDSQQSPDDGRPSTSSKHSRRGPALKRKRRSSAQVSDSHQSASSISSTHAAEHHQPVSAGAEEDEMPMGKRRRMESFVKLHYCDWSGIISDQKTAPITERRAEDQNGVQSSACAAEDHGLQEAVSSGVEDQQVQTPPAPVHHSPALLQEWFKPVSEESASQERQRKKSSCVDLLSLHWSSGEHLSLHSSGSGQAQKVEDQTTATISERHAEGKSSDQLRMWKCSRIMVFRKLYPVVLKISRFKPIQLQSITVQSVQRQLTTTEWT